MSRYYRQLIKSGSSAYTARTTSFATATGITDLTILGALNTFDLGLISNSLDSKVMALYPFVGGTSTTCKYNFMDARDLDIAFRLQFYGGGTFSSNGYQPNGNNAYADTFLFQDLINPDSIHLSYYSRTQNTSFNGGAIGMGIEGVNTTYLAPYYNSEGIKFFTSGAYPTNIASSNNTTTTGLIVGSKNAINSRKLYLNSTLLATNTTSYSYTFINRSFYLGALNYGTPKYYTGFQCAMSSIGSGLSDAEVAILSNLTQAFQTSLSRNV